MAPGELTDEWTANLIGSNRSQQEFFALPDMQCDGVPARGLVLGEVLERIRLANSSFMDVSPSA